jgi:hypothetical protein
MPGMFQTVPATSGSSPVSARTRARIASTSFASVRQPRSRAVGSYLRMGVGFFSVGAPATDASAGRTSAG